MAAPPPNTATPRGHEVREFKGMHAVFRGERLVTRTNDEAAATAYAAAADAAPGDRKPFASKLEPVDQGE